MDKAIISMTRQRMVILEELKSVVSHPSADDVFRMVRGKLPHISLGTVYRNLEMMAQCGLIRKLETGGSQMRFDANTDNHCHIRCERCGRVDDLPAEPLADISSRVRDTRGYLVLGFSLQFGGFCPNCRAADAEQEKDPA